MTATANRQILLVETPKDKLGPQHFRLTEAPMPTPKDGEALLRVRYISLDAANRAWMQGATYREAVTAGSVMAGGAIAEVVESKAPGFAPGDLVFADTGWQDYVALPAKRLHQGAQGRADDASAQRLRHRRPHRLLRPAAHRRAEGRRDRGRLGGGRLGRLHRRADRQDQGLPRRRHRRRPGQVRLAGARSSASTPPSTTRPARSSRPLKAAAPKGIDVYFDNVGGDILEACLFQMNNGGRVVLLRRHLRLRRAGARRRDRAACRASSSSSGSP